MRKNVLFLTLLAILSAMLLNLYGRQQSVFAFNVNKVTEDEIKDELIIAIFVESITKYVNDYYSEFYSGQIMVYNYEIDILEMEKTNGVITVKFGVTPMVGAHNPLGYDELSYSVNYAGKGTLTAYEHIENYPLPEKFQEYIIKPVTWAY